MSFPHNYLGPTKLFSDLYLAKFLNISVKFENNLPIKIMLLEC